MLKILEEILWLKNIFEGNSLADEKLKNIFGRVPSLMDILEDVFKDF